MYRRKWKPSRTKAQDFKNKMQEIDEYCAENGITQSRNSDSYYFTHNGIEYRVSNHSVEASNAGAYTAGMQTRELYHPEGRKDLVCIHASKTRIIEIHKDILAGHVLDGKGNRKKEVTS